MSKSIDTILKELIESQTKQTVALNEKLTALAGDNNTYFDRMKKMEDGLTEAMKKVLEMDASMKECNKEMCKKVDDMESRYAAMFNPEQLKDKERMKDQENHEKNEPASIEKQEMQEMSDAEKKKKQDEADKKEHLKDDTKIFNDQKKELLKEAGKYKDQGGLYQGPSEAKAEYEEGSTQEPRRPDQDEAKDVIPKPADASNTIEGVYPEKVTGQPDDEEDAPKQKRIRGGKKSKAEETNEEPKAEEIKEVKAEQAQPAPVASEESSINATAKALNSKIEAVLEKLASVSQPKADVSAEVEAAKVALANETKAKEEAIAHMKALNEKFEALMAKVSTIEKSASTVEQKAAQIVAQTGVDAVAVSVDQQAKSSEQTDEEVFKQFETLKGPEQRKYYLANKAVIERHASSLLRAKRS